VRPEQTIDRGHNRSLDVQHHWSEEVIDLLDKPGLRLVFASRGSVSACRCGFVSFLE
jgi:hypothetical protein